MYHSLYHLIYLEATINYLRRVKTEADQSHLYISLTIYPKASGKGLIIRLT